MQRIMHACILAFTLSAAVSQTRADEAPAPELNGAAYASDVNYLIDQIAAHYAYLPDSHVPLATVRWVYAAQARRADNEREFIAVLERLTAEFHDHHMTLDVNTATSPQLVPSGAEIWAHMAAGGHVLVDEVRQGSAAEASGMRAGDDVIEVDGRGIERTVAVVMMETVTPVSRELLDYTVRVLLAGTHNASRTIRFKSAAGEEHRIVLAPYSPPPTDSPLTARWQESGIAYIRIENSLGDSNLVPAFDQALETFKDAKGLILDLRNTPSGGNTDVAEPILGRFISKAAGYQRVFQPGEGKVFPQDSFVKEVSPRGPFTFTAPMVVLVDHWTASMGEGMSIGLDGMGRATIVGTPMARLCGGTGGFVLPNSQIGVHFPVERLYHVNGTPREEFVPPVSVDLTHTVDGDAILAGGLAELHTLIARGR
jgi:C-terminal processing protease CtpA/Prc